MHKLNMKKQTILEKLTLVEGTCVEAIKRKTYKNNKTGYKGIFLTKAGKYRASIGFQKKTINLGEFSTIIEARKARAEAEKYYFEPILAKYGKEKDHATRRPEETSYQG